MMDDTYPAEIEKFEACVKGDAESFYMHVICFYMPQIARHIYDTIQTGVSVWLMQQCRHKNVEAKSLH